MQTALSPHEIVDARGEFAQEVLTGLSRSPRSIPCRFFYDAEGSALFEEITQLEEYYPTRTETALLASHGAEIAEHVGGGVVLVEFGSGSARKTSLLLDALDEVRAYIPIDVSEASQAEAAERLKARHPGLTVVPLIADFTKTRALPPVSGRASTLGYFSGSTIGNLSHSAARAFLEDAARLLGPDSAFLIGVDLKKSLDILLPAYNDASGVTAAFNLNLLARINRELDGTFDLERFAHEAIYNDAAGRMEIYIVSLAKQTASVLGRTFSFEVGERIHTENSHKYTVAEFQALAESAGWRPEKAWTNPDQLFSLHLLRL
jgi:dimethylhistidine N-methyltransferase